MAFTLDKIIPWGRTYDEYVKMFDLDEVELTRARIPSLENERRFTL